MKKKLLALLLVVAMVASLAVGLSACNKKDGENSDKASNSETIATAVAMLCDSGSAAAAAGEEDSGFSLDFGASASVVALIPGFENFKAQIGKMVEDYVDMAAEFAKENSVSVKNIEIATEDVAHQGSTAYEVTVMGKDDADKDVVIAKYTLYIKATKADKTEADIEGTEDYNFALTVAEGGEDLATINGNAKFDNSINGMKFSFDLEDLLNIDASAYATESGSIIVEFGATVSSVTFSAKIEVGKLSDNSYGAKVNANVAVGTTLSAVVSVNVVANKNDTTHDFTLDGTADITLASYNASANLSGYADYEYDAEDEEFGFDFLLTGSVSLVETSK